MTDPTPNGQTWVCGWTDVGANCLAGDPCDPETCGYRPVPPAPSSDERAPFADLTDEEFAVFAEGAGFDPAPRSDTPAHSGRDGLTLREAAIEAILIREQDTAFSVVARHIAALFTSLDAIPPTCPTATCHGCPDPEACEALRPTPTEEAR